MPIALAATFNPALVERVFSNVSHEALVKYYISQKDSSYGDNAGISFFTPNINIFRDPRWGRGMETYGEDPFLTAMMGSAVIRGLQGNDTMHLLTSACVKHFAAHSGPEAIRHQFDAEVSPRDLWCTYLPAFHYIIEQGNVQQVMCGYNRLNGEPCCTNEYLLIDLLRNRWHYNGLIVTDCWALNDCWERDTVIPRHETYATAALTAKEAFGSEVDLECGSGLAALKEAVDSGYIPESKINEHLRRILSLRFRLELEEKTAKKPIATQGQNQNIAREASLQSLVLLKNDHVAKHYPQGKHHATTPILPFSAYGKALKLAVVGPNCNDSLMALGNYNGIPEHCTTILEGLQEKACNVVYTHPACDLVQAGRNPGHKFWKNLKNSDAIVFVGGLSPSLEGEELKVEQPGFCKGDRTQIELPAAQRDMIKKIKQRTGRPIVLVLCTGGAIALNEVVDDVDAIVVAWYGGEEMGSAVAQALMGGPMRGHLPVTFYKSTQQLPPFDDYNMEGRTYRYMTDNPLFPFGFGLSYGDARVDSVWYDTDGQRVCGVVSGKTNTQGDSLLVQVYLQGYESDVDANKTLVAFQWISLPKVSASDNVVTRSADGRTEVTFSIPLDAQWMTHFDELSGETRPFKFGTPVVLRVGTSSADKDLKSLPITWE
jgi:beta-glucosidase